MEGRNENHTSIDMNTGASNRSQAKDPKVQRLKEHVDEVSNIMQQNIDKIMERGSNLDYLENRSEFLSTNADEFRVGARRIQRKMWWQNMRINIIIGLVIAIIIVIIIVSSTSSS